MRAWIVALLAVCGGAQAAEDVSFVNEGIIPAPVEQVWKVFSTAEGYKALGPALADIDLRVGGTIRSRYRADGVLGDAETIENVILAYEPPTMIALRIQKIPATFPFKQVWAKPWTVMTLRPVEGGTHLRVASMGYGTDEESAAMRRFFEAGNQQTIETLRRHFGAAPAP